MSEIMSKEDKVLVEIARDLTNEPYNKLVKYLLSQDLKILTKNRSCPLHTER